MENNGLQTSGDQENDAATSNRSMPDQHDKGYAHWFAIFFVAMLESLPLGLVVVKSLWKSYAGGVGGSVTPGLSGKAAGRWIHETSRTGCQPSGWNT